MFSRHLFPFRLLIVAVLLQLPCGALKAADVGLKFVSLPKSVEPLKVKLALAEGKTIEITAQSEWLSDTVRVPAMENWVIGDMAVGTDGKTVFKEYGRAKALASPSQVIVLVRKGKQADEGLEVVSVDAQEGGFSKGKFLFMSAARVDIGGVVGDKKFAIKPSEHAIIKPGAAPNEQMMQTVFFYRHGDESKPFFSSRWPLSDEARSLVFFYHEPETAQLRFHTIRDFPQVQP